MMSVVAFVCTSKCDGAMLTLALVCSSGESV